MKNKTIFSLIIFGIMLYSNLSTSQDDIYQTVKHHSRLKDSYQFPVLPRVQSPGTGINSVIKHDFIITLRDNVSMDCSKFYPDVPNPYLPNGYPTVIMIHGYGDRKETLEGFASAQASFGYVVYTYSVRGQGNSGGLSNLISTTEAQDLIEYVNFIRTDFSTGLDTSKILIMGGSQGGTLPYMAACMGGLHVKTIISALTSPKFASSWIENGSIKMTFLWTIDYTPDTARYNSQVTAMRNWVYSSAADKWDSLAYWVPQNRDFQAIVPQNTIPIMLENAWQDKFFNAYGNLSTIPILTSPKRYYFGAVRGHGGDFSVTEDTWHENFFNEWFYYWLWNIDNGILTRPIFHYAYTTFPETNGMWSFVHDSSAVWPPASVSNMTLYFRNNGQLLVNPGLTTTAHDNLVNNVKPTLTMQRAVADEFKGSFFRNRFKKATLNFVSNKLTQDVRMIGTPQIGLDYSSNAAECQFNFQIYEVSSTRTKLITRVNYTDRNNIVNSRKNTLINGLSHSHIFKAGDKIKIVVTNLDTAPDDTLFLGSNPHVLPDLKNAASSLFYTNKSYITFQVKANGTSPFGGDVLENNTNTNSTSSDNLTPKEFSLSQNYPNPFNPSTVINYSIPQNSFVTLKVYDIAGKEVATLVNTQSVPGNYSVDFNANNFGLSSGIYFYKIVAGSFVNVKKLVLIK